jgi:RNA polymerase sigma factor (sigma-70 family)
MTGDDMELVRRFARDGSEEAFAALVSRHVNLVHSVALREVRDSHLAEEITQTVFILLARKADSLSSGTILSGWLCRTARFVSARALTLRRRRLVREQEAYMQTESQGGPDPDLWQQIEPLLEAAMGRLPETDHGAIVLRYFEGKSFRDVASALGTTEAGAKMRVNRALAKLRALLLRRGVMASAAAIAAAVAANSVQAAPAGLANSVFVTATQGAAATSSLAALTSSSLKVMAWSKVKTAAVATVVLLLAAGTTIHAILYFKQTVRQQPQEAKFVGYATPEASVQSSLWAGSVGDFDRFLDGCTDDMAARLRGKMAGKSDAEIRAEAINWANAIAGYRIRRKEVVSADEVHLHITAPPSPDGLRNGSVVMVMKKIGGSWKQAGDL